MPVSCSWARRRRVRFAARRSNGGSWRGLLGLFGNIGSNLNQIARAANSGDGIDAVDFARELANLQAARDAILKALGRDP